MTTAACLEKAEQKLIAEISSIRAFADRPDRQERQIRRREQDIAKGRRMRASYFNIAVSYYSLSRKVEARQYAEKVVDDEQFGERARDLLIAFDRRLTAEIAEHAEKIFFACFAFSAVNSGFRT